MPNRFLRRNLAFLVGVGAARDDRLELDLQVAQAFDRVIQFRN